MHLAHPQDPSDPSMDHLVAERADMASAQGAPSRAREGTISQRSLQSARDAAVEAGGAAHAAVTPAQVHQTASCRGQAPPKCFRSRHEKGKQGCKGMPLRFGPWWPQLAGRRSDSGQNAAAHRWIGSARDRPRAAVGWAPAPCSSTGRSRREAGAQRPPSKPACSSSSSPRWLRSDRWRLSTHHQEPTLHVNAAAVHRFCRLQLNKYRNPQIRPAPAAGQSDHPSRSS